MHMNTRIKISFIALLICSTEISICAENAETYPVSVYDESGNLIATSNSLNDVATYLNGSNGNIVELSANSEINEKILFSEDSFLYITSDEEGVLRTISGNIERFLEFASENLKLVCQNIIFSGNAKDVFYATSNGTLTLGGNVEFIGNGGAIRAKVINVSNEASGTASTHLKFLENQWTTVQGDLIVGEKCSVTFEKNSLYGLLGNLEVKSGAKATFVENTQDRTASNYDSCHSSGSAVGGKISIAGSGNATFDGNTTSSTSNMGSSNSNGGAVFGGVVVNPEGSVSFTNNASIASSRSDTATAKGGAFGGSASIAGTAVFSDNSVIASGTTAKAYGGAISVNNDTITISIESGGNVTFSGNVVKSSASSTSGAPTRGYDSHAYGGAIYGNLSIESNASVIFSGNSVSSSTKNAYSYGGAVCGETISVQNGASATFSENSVDASGGWRYGYGGAMHGIIYSLAGNLLFEKNEINTELFYSRGGAISSSTDGFSNASSLSASVSFTSTKASEKIIFSENRSKQGGAIYSSGSLISSSESHIEFLRNSASAGGAIYSTGNSCFSGKTVFDGNSGSAIYTTGNLEFSESSETIFRNNIGTVGSAIYVRGATKVILSGNLSFLDNVSVQNGGAIYTEGSIECAGNETNVIFDGNKYGSDSASWMNNDISLASSTSSMAIRDAGTYDFGGGILATAGGSLSIDEANVTFRATSSTAIGGTTTVSGGATVCVEAGATFTTNALTIGSSGKLVFGTQGAESASIVVVDAANISLDATACLEVAAYGAYVESTRFQVLEWTSGDGTPLEAVLTRSNFSVLVNGLACDDDRWRFGVDGNSVYVELLKVPEPSIFGLLAGAGALALCLARRRRRER